MTNRCPVAALEESDDFLTQKAAEQYKNQIIKSVSMARRAIYEMDFRRGYQVLGYDSFRKFAQSLPVEQAQVYRQRAAAHVEVNLNVEMGSIKESVLRPLTRLSSAEDQRKIWKKAKKAFPDQEIPTAKQIMELLQSEGYIKPKQPPTADAVIEKISKLVPLLSTGQDCRSVLKVLQDQFDNVKKVNSKTTRVAE